MPDPLANTDRLFYLADVVCDGRASDSDLAELDAILFSDEASRCRYLDYCRMHATLALDLQAQRAVRKAWQQIDFGLATPFDVDSNLTAVPPPADRATSSPVVLSLDGAVYGTAGFFSSGWPVAYLIATVIFGIGLLVGSHVYMSGPEQLARQSAPNRTSNPQSLIPNPSPKTELVGRITGVADCRWVENPKSEIINHKSDVVNQEPLVRLGDKFTLASGLLEITYNTGAKVILQGPVSYEAETNGGFLSVGKLTGKLERQVASGQWSVVSKSEIRNQKSATSNPQSPIPNPSLSTNRYPLFTVKTPTAIVTDLGTEFGVVVSGEGLTQVHVLQGAVETRTVGAKGSAECCHRVTEGLAVEIGRKGKQSEAVAFLPQSFVRKLDTPAHTAAAEAAYIKAVLTDKPLGYWPLNEPAGTKKFLDRSGNGFHGYAINRVTAGQPGPLLDSSHAVAFDGDGFINVGGRDEFALKNGFTVEAWVLIGNIRRQLYGRVISVDPGTPPGIPRNAGWSLEIARPDPQDRNAPPATITFCTYAVQNYRFAVSDEPLPENRWLHVAVVFDADNSARLYLNGERRGTIAGTRCANVGPVWVEIGDGTGSLTKYVESWHGRLAHVAIYPYTLNQPQIQSHYNQKSAKGNDVQAKVALPHGIATEKK